MKIFVYLICIWLELTELDALFQLDPPDGPQVLDVHLPLLDVVQEDLDPGLAVVLAVRHEGDPRPLEGRQEVAAPLGDLEGRRLDVGHVLVQVPQLDLSLLQISVTGIEDKNSDIFSIAGSLASTTDTLEAIFAVT